MRSKNTKNPLTQSSSGKSGENLLVIFVKRLLAVAVPKLSIKECIQEKKPYSCDVCQKSFAISSGIYHHNKTADHTERMKSKNTNNPLTQSSFVDCGESIKLEDIKEEINEEVEFMILLIFRKIQL